MKVQTDLRAAVLQDRQIPLGIMLTVQEIQEQRIPARVIQTVEMVLMTTVLMTIVLMMTAPMMKGIMMSGYYDDSGYYTESDCEYPFDMNLIHELENNGSLRKYKRDTHRNMGVSFLPQVDAYIRLDRKRGGIMMKNRFEIQGNCLTVHLPREVDHPAADEIRRRIRQYYCVKIIYGPWYLIFRRQCLWTAQESGMIMGRYRADGDERKLYPG